MRYFLAFILLSLTIEIVFAGQGCGPFNGNGQPKNRYVERVVGLFGPHANVA
ncbi:5602_t:CDS:2 [Cetraspora pellucida]|uniref:5602_t:CDS:1 n=1 Tax=Cetraspora pellucida TaxID=1433469 RepID=A0ACA9PA80_9GLOM|nr:5602_t:CDS:2 [Cetraspora pellucida]